MKNSLLLWCGIVVCLIVVAPRSLRGENAEPTAKGFRTDVVAALKELRVPIVRWPGGCFASGYHWEAGVGKHRLPTDDMAWGVIDPNTFGTDEYVQFCRLLEWQPYICNNAGNGTVAEMKRWVEYCNARQGQYADERASNGHPQPWDVRIWSIGNENWGPLPDGRYAAIVLAGDSPEAFNDIDHPDRVVPEATQIDCVRGTLTLPAHSLTIVKHAAP